ncbi:ricin-type beta-trefoil lectin domain protein [Streptomyces sp. NBC_01257]|uniref:ricin-type beta-trefoil lectin domain protein n=1 Tax=Streptomyces sp. NBC_01257 TaxID=2903799 RepID=UPI002DDB3EBF|nr:ricin-type beta-trefoil lectin domain protein [Streptomyces sp. NBC_01257]WRZ68329.1 ricin-type beta-trefoil lectin domain protein [Streptomyces sp. NBC_01257]
MKKRSFATLALISATATGMLWGGTLPAAAAARAAAPGEQSVAAASALRVMPLGDSITDGLGSSTGNGYRGPLWDELSSKGYSLDFVGTSRAGSMGDPDNEGHSGWRIDQIASIADASLSRYRPNVVTLMIGTNDLGQNYQVPTAPDRLNSLIDQVVADAPDATVLVASLTVSTNPTIEANRGTFNQRIPGMVQAKQAAGKHVRYVDMGALTTGDLADGLHPNDAGYRKMADAFDTGIRAADDAGWIGEPVRTGGQVRSAIAGKCMDVNGGSSANGTPVQLWSCNNTDAQWWTAGSNGTLRALGKCLDATGLGTANGTEVELWDCNGGTNQVWEAYNGGYRNPASGRCLDDPAASTTDGTRLVLWDCNGGPNQKWTAV